MLPCDLSKYIDLKLVFATITRKRELPKRFLHFSWRWRAAFFLIWAAQKTKQNQQNIFFNCRWAWIHSNVLAGLETSPPASLAKRKENDRTNLLSEQGPDVGMQRLALSTSATNCDETWSKLLARIHTNIGPFFRPLFAHLVRAIAETLFGMTLP